MRSEEREVTVEVEVRYAETDAMGVVHHSRYLVWFELARTRLCLVAGIHYAEIERQGYFLVVSRAEATYRRGARYGDTAQVTCRLTDLGSRRMRFDYEVRRAGELLVEGATEHLWVKAADGRPCRIPEALRAPFERMRAPCDGA